MQAKIDAFFKPKSHPPPPPFDDLFDEDSLKRPQIHITYERRASIQRKGAATDEGSIEEASKSPLPMGPSLKPTASNGGVTLNRRRSYAQLHLELGQSDFLLRTCFICGLKYAPGDESDEKLHRAFHRNYNHGVQFKGWRNERVVHVPPGDVGRVILVLDGDPPAHRNKVQEVEEMMEVEFGSGWILNNSCKVYLFIFSHRIVGCLVAEPIKDAHKVIPNPADGDFHKSTTTKRARTTSTTLQFGNVSFQREVAKREPLNDKKPPGLDLNGATMCEDEAVPATCGVRAIWVSPANRRKHIASHLLDAVRKGFHEGLVLEQSQLAFSQPTSAGKALVSTYTGLASFLVYQSSSSSC